MEILLIVVGLIIVAVSYIVSETVLERKTDTPEQEVAVDENYIKQVREESQKQIKEDAQNALKETIEEEINKVDDQLSHLSNEKIMAVSEFSDQLLEKIEQNHKEVVFLYDMLNEKENEMKEFVQEIDKSKVVLEELANKELEKQKMLQHKRIQKELEKQLKREEELEREKIELLRSRVIMEEKQNEPIPEKKEVKRVETQVSALERMGQQLEEAPTATPEIVEENTAQEVEAVQEDVAESVQKETVQQQSETEMVQDNQNQAILEMYNEGKSIREIAKMLGRGQGEVKLVIDLFQGADR